MTKTFAQATQDRGAYQLLIDAYKNKLIPDSAKNAIDIGAGSLRHSTYLAKHKIYVTAIDKDASIKKYYNRLSEDVKKYINPLNVNIKDYIVNNQEQFDVVIAIHSLPFLGRIGMMNFLKHLPHLLNNQGIFIATFWGNKDDWSMSDTICTLKKGELVSALGSFDILSTREKYFEGSTTSGKEKVWHIFDIVAQKKGATIEQ